MRRTEVALDGAATAHFPIRDPRLLSIAVALAIVACSADPQPAPDSSSPASGPDASSTAQWSDATRAEAFDRFATFEQPIGAARGGQAMIAGTTGAPAIAAGREALARGGSAVDAVLTAALGQVVLAAQSWVSFGGILTLVVYDAATGEVHSLNAAFAVPSGEQDGATIPKNAAGGQAGRMVLVPGFFAGVEAAHRRYGRLPLESLFVPAIEFAEQGFPLPRELAAMIASKREMIAASQDTSALLLKPDGSCYAAGEVFRQPALAATLRDAATDISHVTTGAWAAKLVERVRAAGGSLAMEDMAAYRGIWSAPVRTDYHGFDVCAAGSPGFGGVNVVEALNVLAVADLRSLADPGERLFWWTQVTNLQAISFLDRLTRLLVLFEPADDAQRVTPEWAATLWEKVHEGRFRFTRPLVSGPAVPEGSHSDAVVAVDREGNIAALVHSSNTGNAWATGIVVDGVSIPDPASFQQDQIVTAGAGARLPDPTNPLIVLRRGKPVLASSSIGAGLHPHTLARIVAVLDDGLGPAAAMAVPTIHFSAWDDEGVATAQVSAGDFDPALLARVRALGQPVTELDERAMREATGYWVGIAIDAEGGLSGACPAKLNGAVFSVSNVAAASGR